MSTQQTDAEYIETLDYKEPVEQEPEPVADTDLTATHYLSVLQPQQPTITQPSIAVQEPVVQSPYTTVLPLPRLTHVISGFRHVMLWFLGC